MSEPARNLVRIVKRRPSGSPTVLRRRARRLQRCLRLLRGRLASYVLVLSLLATPSSGIGLAARDATTGTRVAVASGVTSVARTRLVASLAASLAGAIGWTTALERGWLSPGPAEAQSSTAVWSWGENTWGQLGNGSTTQQNAPTVSSFPTGVTAVSGGGFHTLAITSGQTVMAAGMNSRGQLGDGTTVTRLSPVIVPGLGNVSMVAASVSGINPGWHSLALTSAGQVWAWGDNSAGQLGYTTSTTCSGFGCSLAATQVSALSGTFTQIAAGAKHSLALRSDKTVWAWGDNSWGQLGNGTFGVGGTTPVQVTGLTNVVEIAAGNEHSVARKQDGSVWVWGRDAVGAWDELGIPPIDVCHTPGVIDCVVHPTQVPGLTATTISSGGNNTLALRSDQTVWGAGRLIVDSALDDPPIAQPSAISGVTSIHAGGGHAFARKADGSLWVWGQNLVGQLGVPSEPSCDHGTCAPVQVTGLTGLTAVAAGRLHSLAIATAPPAAALPCEPVPPDMLANVVLLSATGGDPVNTLTGAFEYHHLDTALPGMGPYPTFDRSYNSADTRTTMLGPGWSGTYTMRLRGSCDATADVHAVGPSGITDRHVRNPDATYTPPAGIYTTLTKLASGNYTLTDKEQTVWTFDANGTLISITDRYGNVSTLSYNGSGQLTAINDPANRGSLSLAYNAQGRLTSVTDWQPVTPRTVSYGYDANGRLAAVSDRDGKTTAYGYDGSSGRLATITDANAHTALTLTYDTQGRVSQQKDARGLITELFTQFTYVPTGGGGQVTTVTMPPASYDTGFSPQIIDTYDGQHRLTSRQYKPSSFAADQFTISYGYDSHRNLTSVTDGRGYTTDYCYDVDYAGQALPLRGNRTRVIQPAVTVPVPPPVGAITRRPVTLFKYDSKDNVIQVVAPNGVDGAAAVACNTNLQALGSGIDFDYATDLTYDAAKVKLLEVTRYFHDPDGGSFLIPATTTFSYSATEPGRVTKMIPPRGNQAGPNADTFASTFAYFTSGINRGLLQSTTVPDSNGQSTVFAYDAVGRITSVTDLHGRTWSYLHDKENRLQFAYSPSVGGYSNFGIEQRYDAVGNLIYRKDGNDQWMQYVYDERDALVEVRESLSDWRFVSMPPSSMILTRYAYDNHGRMSRLTRAATSADERVTDYQHDGLGRLRTELQYPSYQPGAPPSFGSPLTTTMDYDRNGNRTVLKQPRDAGAAQTTYDYDTLDRLTQINYTDASMEDVVYQYDRNGNRLWMMHGTSATAYFYDERDMLTQVSLPGSVAVQYRYDADGRRRRLIYPGETGNEHVDYLYDLRGRVVQLSDWGSRTTTYQYELDGQLAGVSAFNGTQTTYTYDPARRLTSVCHWQTAPAIQPSCAATNIIAKTSYTLDRNGNRTHVDDSMVYAGSYAPAVVDPNFTPAPFPTPGRNPTGSGPNATPQPAGRGASGTTAPVDSIPDHDFSQLNVQQVSGISYTYDNLNRLVGAAVGSTTWTYQYDQVGNRTFTDRRGVSSYNYDKADRLTRVVVNGTPNTYLADANGNLIGKQLGDPPVPGAASVSYAYDQANRLIQVASGNGWSPHVPTTTFTYDGDGKRTRMQQENHVAVELHHDVAGGLPVVLDDGSNRYVWGPNGLAYQVNMATGVASAYHADGQGSVRAITAGRTAINQPALVLQTYAFDEFGVPILSKATFSGFTPSNPFTYTGEQTDPELGLINLRARMYDPNLGRFLQRDVIWGSSWTPTSLNRFTYAMANPVTLVDPSGHCVEPVSLTICSTGAIVGWGAAALGVGAAIAVGAGFIGIFGHKPTYGQKPIVAPSAETEAATAPPPAEPPSGKGDCSFADATLVLTRDGLKRIDDIRVGDEVLAYDERTGREGYFTVTAVHTHQDEALVRLIADGEAIETTTNHPFLTQDGDWRPAGRLRVGDGLRQSAGRIGRVATVEPRSGSQVMYNLTVAEAHTYFVGAGGWLVHNGCPTDPQQNPPAPTISSKIARQMPNRGWTLDDILMAMREGQRIRAVNRATGGPATRYVHPRTGQSVVIDDATGDVIHVGGPKFTYGPGSGDVP
ncbi:MAG: polymorphic toxin-type HINT domain-containing protein [Chloroflexota bacterium]